jgi:hypothetical protein
MFWPQRVGTLKNDLVAGPSLFRMFRLIHVDTCVGDIITSEKRCRYERCFFAQILGSRISDLKGTFHTCQYHHPSKLGSISRKAEMAYGMCKNEIF